MEWESHFYFAVWCCGPQQPLVFAEELSDKEA